MNELRDLARQLLTDGTVRVIIGWEDGRRGARPVFITDPADADKLIFDTRCAHNLVTYLDPRRDDVVNLGRIGIVVKGCDAKAVAGLLREAQVARDDVVLIGVRCGGVLEEAELREALELNADNVAPRCFGCDNREPALVNYLVGEALPEPPRPIDDDRRARRRPRRAAARGALGLLERAVQQVRALLRLPAGLPTLCVRALRRRQDAAAVDRAGRARAGQRLLEHHARPPSRRQVRRLRRV